MCFETQASTAAFAAVEACAFFIMGLCLLGAFLETKNKPYSTEFGDKVKIIQPTSGLQYKSIHAILNIFKHGTYKA